jgi:hypothetical protein
MKRILPSNGSNDHVNIELYPNKTLYLIDYQRVMKIEVEVMSNFSEDCDMVNRIIACARK